MGGLSTVLSWVLLAVGAAQIVGSLFDVDVIGEIWKWWKNLGKGAEELKKGIAGVVDELSTQQHIIDRLKGSFSDAEIKQIGIDAGKLIAEGMKEGFEAAEEFRIGKRIKGQRRAKPGQPQRIATFRSDTFLGDLKNFLGVGAETGVEKAEKEISKLRETYKGMGVEFAIVSKGVSTTIEATFADAFTAARITSLISAKRTISDIEKEIADLEKSRNRNRKGGGAVDIANELKELRKDLEAAKLAAEALGENGTAYIASFAAIMSELSDVPMERIIAQFREADSSVKQVGFSIMQMGVEVGNVLDGVFVFTKLGEELKPLLGMQLRFNDLLTGTQDAFDRGAISAETMSQKAGALTELYKEMVATLGKFKLDATAERFKGDEGRTLWAKEFELLKLLERALEQKGKKADDLTKKGVELKKIEEMPENFRKIVQETDKLNSELDKTLLKLEQTKKLLDLKDRLADTKGQIDNINKALKRQTDLRKLDEKLIKSRIEKIKTTLKYDQEDLEILERQNEERAAAAAAAESLANARRTLAAAQGERAGAAALGAAEADLGQMTRNQELYTAEEIRQGKEKVIQIEYQNAMDVLNRQKKQAEIEHGIKIRELSDEYALQQEKTATLERQQGLQENLFTEQDRLLASQRAQEDAAFEATKRKLELQGDQITQEKDIAIQTAENAAESAKIQNELRKTEAENIQAQAKMFLGAIVGLDDTFDKFLEGVSLLAKIEGVDATKVEKAKGKKPTIEIVKEAIEKAGKLVKKTTGIGPLIDANSQQQIDALKKEAERKINNNNLDKNHLLEMANKTAELRSAEDDALKRERSRVLENLQIKLDVSKQEAENILNAVEAEQTLQEAREVGFAAQAEGEKRNRQLKLQALEEERNLILRVSRAISQKLTDRLGNALRSLNTAIMEGTLTMENFKQGFKDFLVGVITDIQSTIFELTIVEPLQEWLRGFIRDIFGLDDPLEMQIANNTSVLKTVQDGKALRVKIVGGSGQLMVDDRPATGGFNTRRDGGLGQLMVDDRPDTGGFNTRRDGGPGSGGRIRDLGGALLLDPISVTAPLLTQNTRDFYTELGSVKSTISEMPTVLSDLNVALQESGINLGQVGATAALTFGGILAATGDFGTALLGTFIQIFTQIIAQSFASSFSFAASGGLIGKHMDVMGVQRLQSGGSVAYRDRVPALLEPGEFVIRKPIARQIGGPALERMNATGAGGGGMPEISVNVKNEGTPKQGDASVQPSFDPKEFVVDIVLKDLRNNGPIKQSMRSGTGRR